MKRLKLFFSFSPETSSAPQASREKGGLANRKDVGIANEQLPALRVSVVDALRFALWLGGDLPTTEQWNKAAGYYETPKGEGPYVEPWNDKDNTQIAVNRGKEGPLPVGTASADISPFGCRDMAGNGQEWTRDLGANARSQRIKPDYKPAPLDLVMLRGQKYVAPEPLHYTDQDVGWEFERVDPFIGFRVVLELQ